FKNSVADFSFACSRGDSAWRDCLKLRTQSANRRFMSRRGPLDSMSRFLAGLAFYQGRRLGRVPLLPLQERLPSVPSATAMRKPVRLFFMLVLIAGFARGAIKTPENAPIEITSTGETSYENGLATARDNVAIHVGDTDIYADYAQYNSRTHEVELRGHVRIYRDKPTTTAPNKHPNKYAEEEHGTFFYLADSGVYNINTKQVHAINA